MAEVERITRRGATINVFMLDDEPRLVDFVEHLAARNGGRVFAPDPSRLGEYVVSDYLRARRGRRGAEQESGPTARLVAQRRSTRRPATSRAPCEQAPR